MKPKIILTSVLWHLVFSLVTSTNESIAKKQRLYQSEDIITQILMVHLMM
jgi:hypothetical protein